MTLAPDLVSAAAAEPRRADGDHIVPYPGLRPFRPDEESLFFGRERQVDRMIDKLAVHRFLAVVGTSGGGKSSLVNCGLRPALQRGLMASAGSSWRIAQFRPGGDAIRAFAEALAAPRVLFEDAAAGDRAMLASIIEATLHMSSLGVQDLYAQARLQPDVNLLIVVDQFEELFRYRGATAVNDAEHYGVSASAAAFVQLLLEARTHQRIHVVLTMRSDFLGDCAQFRGLPEAINDGQYLLPRLTREETRAAITGPVSVVGDTLDPLLVTQLLNDVGDSPDQLSILQHALNRTWAYWHHDGGAIGPVSLAHYDAVGGMKRALDQHADKAYGELGTERLKHVCERVFRTLTDRGTDIRGVRRPTPFGTLCEIAAASEDEVMRVLAVFRKASRSFVMPPINETITPVTMIDISHESLMRVWERLKTWSQAEAECAKAYVRLAETAALHEQGRASLWRDAELENAIAWRRENELNAAWAGQHKGDYARAMRFLDASQSSAQEEFASALASKVWLRWRRFWIASAVVLFLLLAIFGVQVEGSTDIVEDDAIVLFGLGFVALSVLMLIALLGGLIYRPIKRRATLQSLIARAASGAAAPMTRRDRVLRGLRAAAPFVAVTAMFLIPIPFIKSWVRNSELERRTHTAIRRANAAAALLHGAGVRDAGSTASSDTAAAAGAATASASLCDAGDCMDSIPSVRRALTALDELRALEQATLRRSAPSGMGWGMWRGARLSDSARTGWLRAYHVAFQDSLNASMNRSLVDAKLEEDPDVSYRILKTALLIQTPNAASRDSVLLRNMLLLLMIPQLPDDHQLVLLQQGQIKYYLALRGAGAKAPAGTVRIDSAAIAEARRRLLAIPEEGAGVRLFMSLVAAADAHVAPVSLKTLSPTSVLTAEGELPGSFTREGRLFVDSALARDVAHLVKQEAWVLNDTVPMPVTTSNREATREYYVSSVYPWWWGVYLGLVKVRPARDLKDLSNVIAQLTGPRSPLRELLELFYANEVNAPANPMKLGDGPGSYLHELRALGVALDSLQASAEESTESKRWHGAAKDALLRARVAFAQRDKLPLGDPETNIANNLRRITSAPLEDADAMLKRIDAESERRKMAEGLQSVDAELERGKASRPRVRKR